MSISWKMNNRKIYEDYYYTSGRLTKVAFYVNTNEIPTELSHEIISSKEKITRFLHKSKYECCYGYIINRGFRSGGEMVIYINGSFRSLAKCFSM